MIDQNEQRSSADIAREAEQQRADLGHTLDELRQKMTPGEIANDLWNLAKGSGGGGDFVRTLGRGVRDNPLPVALIGAGIAWLMSGRGSPSPSFEDQQGPRRRLTAVSSHEDIDDGYGTPHREEDFFDSGGGESDEEGDRRRANWGFRHRARDAAEGAREMGEQLSERASEVGHGISDAAARATSTVGGAVSSAGERAGSLGQNASRRAARLGRRVYRSGARAPGAVRDFVEEQPLVAAAVGLAVGAIIGAAFRPTETESELMGEASDRVKRQASAMAQEGYEAAASAAQRTIEEVKDEADAQGFTTADATDAAGDLKDRAQAVYERGKQAVQEELDENLGKPSEPERGNPAA